MTNQHLLTWAATVLAVVCVLSIGTAAAQAPTSQGQTGASVPEPANFTIGIGDQLSIRVWRDPDASAEVVVRPDGRISLPLINEIDVLGMTTEELRTEIAQRLSEFKEDPTLEVIVTQINSRKVFITGEVLKPGEYPLLAPTNVLQLVAMAGGLSPYADKEHIVVIRGGELRPDGTPWSFNVNYDDITARRNLKENVVWLKPGDTVIVR